jgi:hypothetical protein
MTVVREASGQVYATGGFGPQASSNYNAKITAQYTLSHSLIYILLAPDLILTLVGVILPTRHLQTAILMALEVFLDSA